MIGITVRRTISRVIVITLLLIGSFSVESLIIIDGNRQFSLDLEDLAEHEQVLWETNRERDGRDRIDWWSGVLLDDILASLQIRNHHQLRFASLDKYQIRLTVEELKDHPALIALKRNDLTLSENNLRLVIPGLRDMFWIQGLDVIQVEDYQQMPLPDVIYFAEDLINEILFKKNSLSDQKERDISFTELISSVYPVLQEEFLLIARDGISHRLDFETYLNSGFLIRDDKGYNLQSPDMPIGMWIKNLAYIQFFDRAIIFRDQFTNLSAVKILLDWSEVPERLWTDNSCIIDPDLDFSDPIWINCGKILWPK